MNLELRLINWGRWCRENPHYGHCGSVEHQYRSPQCWNEREPRPDPIDLQDGQRIEWLVRTLHVKHRDMLRLRYVRRYNWQALEKKFKGENVRDLLIFAEIALKNALEPSQALDTVRLNSSAFPIWVLRAALAA